MGDVDWLTVIRDEYGFLFWTVDENLTLLSIDGRDVDEFELRETVGQPLDDIAFPNHTEEHRRALAGEKQQYEEDYKGRHFRTHLVPNGTGVAGIAYDISHRVRNEQMVRRIHADAQADLATLSIRLLGARLAETEAHMKRVGLYSKTIALRLGWDELAAETLRWAAALHDIGKLSVPGELLETSRRLSRESPEFQVIQTHTVRGKEILADFSAPVMELASQVAVAHHEHWDGSGYPAGLAGEAIPEAGRIAAVADVFDALISSRPYKRAWSVERALAYIHQQRAQQFAPDVVEAFFASLGSILEILTSNSEANGSHP